MAVRPTALLSRPWLLRALWTELRVALRLLCEPRVPLAVKFVLPAAALYLLSPLDFLPDILPGLGQVDDLVIVIAAIKLFLRLCPAAAVAFHQAAITAGRPFSPMAPTDVVVDVEFHRE